MYPTSVQGLCGCLPTRSAQRQRFRMLGPWLRGRNLVGAASREQATGSWECKPKDLPHSSISFCSPLSSAAPSSLLHLIYRRATSSHPNTPTLHSPTSPLSIPSSCLTPNFGSPAPFLTTIIPCHHASFPFYFSLQCPCLYPCSQ